MSDREDAALEDAAAGPIIVWEYHGYEGWQAKSYPDVKSALLGERYTDTFVITRRVEFDVTEKESA